MNNTKSVSRWFPIAFIGVILAYIFTGNNTSAIRIDPPAAVGDVEVDQYFVNETGDVELQTASLSDVLQDPDRIVVVDFWATWCGWCRYLEPEIEEVARKMKDEVVIVRLNVDHYQDLAAHFQVSGIPDVRFFYKGEAVGGCGYEKADSIMSRLQSISGQ